MSFLHLTPYQRRQLRAELPQAQSVPHYQRVLALLELDRGELVAVVARRLGVTRQAVYHWAQAFEASPRLATLRDHYGIGRPSLWTDDLHALLRSALRRRPAAFGYAVPNWTVPLLRDLLAHQGGARLSDDTIRRQLHDWGYVWKRYRYVLPPDPEREKKTRHSAAFAGFAVPQCQVG